MIRITSDMSIKQVEGGIELTRPSILGGIHTHTVKTSYRIEQIMLWLTRRATGVRCALVQDEFPDMSKEDREFLMSGITPAKWRDVFGPETGIEEN